MAKGNKNNQQERNVAPAKSSSALYQLKDKLLNQPASSRQHIHFDTAAKNKQSQNVVEVPAKNKHSQNVEVTSKNKHSKNFRAPSAKNKQSQNELKKKDITSQPANNAGVGALANTPSNANAKPLPSNAARSHDIDVEEVDYEVTSDEEEEEDNQSQSHLDNQSQSTSVEDEEGNQSQSHPPSDIDDEGDTNSNASGYYSAYLSVVAERRGLPPGASKSIILTEQEKADFKDAQEIIAAGEKQKKARKAEKRTLVNQTREDNPEKETHGNRNVRNRIELPAIGMLSATEAQELKALQDKVKSLQHLCNQQQMLMQQQEQSRSIGDGNIGTRVDPSATVRVVAALTMPAIVGIHTAEKYMAIKTVQTYVLSQNLGKLGRNQFFENRFMEVSQTHYNHDMEYLQGCGGQCVLGQTANSENGRRSVLSHDAQTPRQSAQSGERWQRTNQSPELGGGTQAPCKHPLYSRITHRSHIVCEDGLAVERQRQGHIRGEGATTVSPHAEKELRAE